MKKRILAVLIFLTATLFGQEAARFGPFLALKIDRDVIEDVQIEDNDIYVKVKESYRDMEFTVKISDGNKEQYRSWYSGYREMRVKVYRSHSKNRQGFTYRINTIAGYVEYWLDEKLVLHLKRGS